MCEMDMGCEICIHRKTCAKTLKECRSYGGGAEDPQLLITKLREKNAHLLLECDVAEVKHGYWIDTTAHCGEFTCSICKEMCVTNKHKYCPHCGAKMDGGDVSIKYYDTSNIETPSVQKYVECAREQLIDAQLRLQNNSDEALKENINAALFYVMEVYAMQTMEKLRDYTNKSYC